MPPYTAKTRFFVAPVVTIWYSMIEMNKAADSTTKNSTSQEPLLLGTIAFDLLDTAWRMTVPVVLLAVGGLVLDKKIDTAPWFTLLGVVVGFVFAALLIKKQLVKVNRKENQ